MNDDTTSGPSANDHGTPEKSHLVFVNDRERVVRSSHITFEEIVALVRAWQPARVAAAFRIGYTNGSRGMPSGSLEPGATVALHGGMRFEVVQIDEDATTP